MIGTLAVDGWAAVFDLSKNQWGDSGRQYDFLCRGTNGGADWRARIEAPKRPRGLGCGEGVSPPQPTRGLGGAS